VHKKNALGHRARRSILDHLRTMPGDHLRGIARALDLTAQNAQYHLRQMEALGFVSSQAVNGKSCWFPLEGGRPVKERAVANSVLAAEARQRIMEALHEMPGLHQGELARRLGLASGSLSWHVGQLVQAGLLAEGREGNTLRYVPTQTALDALGASSPPPSSPSRPTRAVPSASSN
jgi:predicted transcriptional regulator